VRHDYRPMHWANISRRLTWSILKLSIPAAAATVVMMIGFGLFTRAVGKLDAGAASAGAANVAARCGGVEAVHSAANTDIVETLKLTFTACLAFGTATATLISQSLGRRRPDEAEKWGWASVRLGVVLFGIVGLCEGVFFTHQMVALISNSSAVRAEAIFPLRIMGIATPIIAVAMILSEGLFGAGNTKFVAVAQLLLVFGWLVPGAYLLGIVLHLALKGIWIAAFVYACLAAATMSVKFAGGTWKTIKL
jgi:multidrug resistance protein, MATE family